MPLRNAINVALVMILLALHGALATAVCDERVCRLPPVDAGMNVGGRGSCRANPSLAAHSSAGALPSQANAAIEKLNGEIEALYERIESLEKVNEDRPAGLEFGYDNGFAMTSPGGVKLKPGDVPFSLRLNSWMQFRHTYFDSDGPNPDENDLEFERLRLTLQGHAYTSDLKYFMQFDGDSDGAEAVDFLDYYFAYDIGHHRCCLDQRRFGFKVGKWKVPYNRARNESLWKMQFADLSITSGFFDANRALGVGVFGKVDALGKVFVYETGVFNGLRNEGFRPGRRGELDRNFAYAGRVHSVLVGEWGDDGQPDLHAHEHLAVRVGAGTAITRVDNEGLREFERIFVVDSGATLASILPPGVTAYDLAMYACDANFKYRGLSFHSEYYWRHIFNFAGAPVPDLFDHGFFVQSGYFIVPEKFELAARWSRIVGDSGTLGATTQSADEITAGCTWYFNGNNAKLTFDATHINGAPLTDSRLNLLAGDIGWLYRTQLQLRF